MYLQNKQLMDFWVNVDSIFSALYIISTVVQIQYLIRDKWVGTTSIHGLEDRGMEMRFAEWSRFIIIFFNLFFYVQSVVTGSGTHTAFCLISFWNSVLGGEVGGL